jgi:hypothetical protein
VGVVIKASNNICYVIDSYQANGAPTQTVVNEYANCSECLPTPPTPPTPPSPPPTPPTPPTPVSTVSYNLSRCPDFVSFTSQAYPTGTFSSGQRVEGSVGVFYIVTGTRLATSGLSVTSTGQTGCP